MNHHEFMTVTPVSQLVTIHRCQDTAQDHIGFVKRLYPKIAILGGENHEEPWELRVFPSKIKQMHVYSYIHT